MATAQSTSRAKVKPVAPALNPRSLLFTLYGDYVHPVGQEELRVSALVQLAADLDVSGSALRSALSRMTHEGWLEACRGDGLRRIEMNFLPDVFVTCEVCRGRRYNGETLAVKYKSASIADLLEMTVQDALPLLENIPQIRQKLQTLVDVGLGYIHLGQSSTTLSGGEAQRIKLARELSRRQTGRTLYILDEPTTGLHFDDVKQLLQVLNRLTDLGNTVIIIEHHLDVIKQADWIIDLGPEGGESGGRVVAQGRPEDVVRSKRSFTGQALAAVLKNGRATHELSGAAV